MFFSIANAFLAVTIFVYAGPHFVEDLFWVGGGTGWGGGGDKVDEGEGFPVADDLGEVGEGEDLGVLLGE